MYRLRVVENFVPLKKGDFMCGHSSSCYFIPKDKPKEIWSSSDTRRLSVIQCGKVKNGVGMIELHIHQSFILTSPHVTSLLKSILQHISQTKQCDELSFWVDAPEVVGECADVLRTFVRLWVSSDLYYYWQDSTDCREDGYQCCEIYQKFKNGTTEYVNPYFPAMSIKLYGFNMENLPERFPFDAIEFMYHRREEKNNDCLRIQE